MSKKVLVVEASPSIRGIAESLLRQNGYEVISTDGAETARRILQESKVELLLVASDTLDASGQPIYDTLATESSSAGRPCLILHDPVSGELGYPPESIIVKPFTPRDFLDKVMAFSGGPRATVSAQAPPFTGADVEDELIDAALGLNQLEIDETEVIGDDTGAFRVHNRPPSKESMIGYEFGPRAEDSTTPKCGIDQIHIPAESAPGQTIPPPTSPMGSSPIPSPPQFPGQTGEYLSTSSKIEIVSDQYGITSSPDLMEPVVEDIPGKAHDYDWFVDELKKEVVKKGDAPFPRVVDSGSPKAVPSAAPPIPPIPPAPPGRHQEDTTAAASPARPVSHHEAVDAFIEEFKREVEKISEPSVPTVTVPAADPRQPQPDGELKWDEVLEKISPADIRLISQNLIDAVAQRMAEKIVARLDQQAVYQILRECLSDAVDKLAAGKEHRTS